MDNDMNVLPNSLDIEMAVLGAILKDEEALHLVVEKIDSEDAFYSQKHRAIYREILGLYRDSKECDIVTVAEALSKREKLSAIGGRVYLVELVEGVASTANVVQYSELLMDKFLLRRLIDVSQETLNDCYNQDSEAGEVLDRAEQGIFDVSEKRFKKGFVPVSDLIPPTLEGIDKAGKSASIATGFEYLDSMTSGLHGGDLIIIAGRPSMGKSSLAVNIAEHVAINLKKPVGLFSLEMSDEQVALRMMCGLARIPQQRVRSNRMSEDDWTRLSLAATPLSEAPIFIDDSPTLSSMEIRAKARRLKAQHDVALIIVDYMQMVHGSERSENRQQEMAGISLSLKALAKELKIPVIACSQLSRQVEHRAGEKRPHLSDLRESGSIEQDADVVIFIYRPEQYLLHLERTDPRYLEAQGRAEIIVAKQRNGPTGVVYLTFLKEFARFENMASNCEVSADTKPTEGADVPF